jgi:hypothetical protein
VVLALPRAPHRFPQSASTATPLKRDTLRNRAQALNAPLPPNWSEDVTDDGTVFFRNHLTGAVNWSHPLDDHFRGLIVKLKVRHLLSPRWRPTRASVGCRCSVGNSVGLCLRSTQQA